MNRFFEVIGFVFSDGMLFVSLEIIVWIVDEVLGGVGGGVMFDFLMVVVFDVVVFVVIGKVVEGFGLLNVYCESCWFEWDWFCG